MKNLTDKYVDFQIAQIKNRILALQSSTYLTDAEKQTRLIPLKNALKALLH